MRLPVSVRRIGTAVVVIIVLYAGYRAWWTPAVGGGPHNGDFAPTFTLFDQNGATQTLSEYTAKGPVIVAFYRGYW